MTEWIDAFLSSGIRVSTPILLAALACLPTLWTRDINIGLEGIMVFGAFLGAVLGLAFHSALLAVLVIVVIAIVVGLLFGIAVAGLKVDVFVAGLVLIVVAGAAAAYMLEALFGVKGTLADPSIPALPKVVIPGVADVPILGPILSGNSVLTWLSVVLVVFLAVMERKSVLARHLKAAGSHPVALATAGVSVLRMRLLAQAWCFVLAALAGVQISLGQLALYTEGMIGGMGFIALAAAIFSRGKVWAIVVVSLGFGFATSLTYQVDKNVVPTQLTQMVPYVAALLGLVIISRRGLKRRSKFTALS